MSESSFDDTSFTNLNDRDQDFFLVQKNISQKSTARGKIARLSLQSANLSSRNILKQQNSRDFSSKNKEDKFDQISLKQGRQQQSYQSKRVNHREQISRDSSQENVSYYTRKNSEQVDQSNFGFDDDYDEQSMSTQTPIHLQRKQSGNFRIKQNKEYEMFKPSQKRESFSSRGQQKVLTNESDQQNGIYTNPNSQKQTISRKQIYQSNQIKQNQKVFNNQTLQRPQTSKNIFTQQSPQILNQLKMNILNQQAPKHKISDQYINQEAINTVNNSQNPPFFLNKLKNQELKQNYQQTSNRNSLAQKYFGQNPDQQTEIIVISKRNIIDIEPLNSDEEREVQPLMQKTLTKGIKKHAIKQAQDKLTQMFQRLPNTFDEIYVKQLREIILFVNQAEKNEEKYLNIIAPLIYEREKKINLVGDIIKKIEEKNNQLEEKNNQLEQKLLEEQKQVQELQQQNKSLKTQQTKYQNSKQTLQQKIKETYNQLENQKNQNILLQKEMEILQKQQNQNQKKNIENLFEKLSFSKISGDNSEQVQNLLKQLNPEAEIQDKLVQYVKNFQNVIQNQPKKEQQSELQIQNDNLVKSYLQSQQQNKQLQLQQQQNDSIKKPSPIKNDQDAMQCLLVLQSMYKQDGITTFITSDPIQSLESDKNYEIQQSFLQTGLHNQASYFSLKINQDSDLYSKLIQSSNQQQLQDFIQDIKKDIAKKIDSQDPFKDVVVLNLSYDSIPQIDFQINSQKYNQTEIKKKVTFKDIGVSLSEKSLLEFAKLSVNMFNPDYNMEWPESQRGKYDYRGQLKIFDQDNPEKHKYYFPAGYKGYALNIDRYGYDQNWLSQNSDEKTWIVLFHGTNEKAIEGITNNNLAPGYRNLHGGGKCRITDTTIKEGAKANVYLTDDLNVAEYFADITSVYEGKKVDPKGVKSPVKEITYYTVENNQHIRPYRILLKEFQ